MAWIWCFAGFIRWDGMEWDGMQNIFLPDLENGSLCGWNIFVIQGSWSASYVLKFSVDMVKCSLVERQRHLVVSWRLFML